MPTTFEQIIEQQVPDLDWHTEKQLFDKFPYIERHSNLGALALSIERDISTTTQSLSNAECAGQSPVVLDETRGARHRAYKREFALLRFCKLLDSSLACGTPQARAIKLSRQRQLREIKRDGWSYKPYPNTLKKDLQKLTKDIAACLLQEPACYSSAHS